jgi:predicted transcriptional regulator
MFDRFLLQTEKKDKKKKKKSKPKRDYPLTQVELLDYIHANPGQDIRWIRYQFDMSETEFLTYLQELEMDGLVVSQEEGKRLKYYPSG